MCPVSTVIPMAQARHHDFVHRDFAHGNLTRVPGTTDFILHVEAMTIERRCMALKIRLARGGAKKRPFYRSSSPTARSPRDGRFIEKLGTYNPMLAQGPSRARDAEDRAHPALAGVGALPSDRVARFLGDAGLGAEAGDPRDAEEVGAGKKAQERAKRGGRSGGQRPGAPAASSG